MQFNVPQFIEIKDKIIGPLTMRQFLYILAGVAALGGLWFFIELWLFIIITIPIAIFCLMLAFYKFNGRPFIYFVGSVINYLIKPKLYLWKRKNKM